MKSIPISQDGLTKANHATISIALVRDQAVLIKRGADDPKGLKQAFAKTRRIMRTLPADDHVDTVVAVRKVRRLAHA